MFAMLNGRDSGGAGEGVRGATVSQCLTWRLSATRTHLPTYPTDRRGDKSTFLNEANLNSRQVCSFEFSACRLSLDIRKYLAINIAF